MYLSQADIEELPRVHRLNLINSVTGIKPANLVGTRSENGEANLAIFSSVVHLGSNPAVIGLVFRPQHDQPRDTYRNIQASGIYTINQVPAHLIRNAHYTSAKFPGDVSEFERCAIPEEYLFDFDAPFVKESGLKMGLEMVEEIPIKTNQTILMVGKILHLQFPDEVMEREGHLNLQQLDAVGIGGLNSYYTLSRTDQFPYVHLKDVPTILIKKQHLPTKICSTCGKPFTWRKKWKKVWEEVKYCSERCRRARRTG